MANPPRGCRARQVRSAAPSARDVARTAGKGAKVAGQKLAGAIAEPPGWFEPKWVSGPQKRTACAKSPTLKQVVLLARIGVIRLLI